VLATTGTTPYNVDVLNTLFSQTSSFYRFRYRTRWVSEDIKKDIRKICESKGIVVLCSLNPKDPKPILIRRVLIKNVETSGDFVYIEFQNLDFVSSKETNLIEQIGKSVGDEVSSKNPSFLFVSKITAAGPPPNSNDDDLEQWTETINKVGEFEGFERATFLKLKSIEDLDKNRSVDIDSNNGRYKIMGSRTYEIDIIQSMTRKSQDKQVVEGGITMTASAPDAHINLVRNCATIVGRYDMLQILFRTKKRALKTDSIIALSADEKQIMKARKNPRLLPNAIVEPTINLTIGMSRSLLWIVPLIVLGLVMTAFGAAYSQSGFDFWRALTGAVVGAVGAIVSAYLGLRYLSEE